MLMLNDFNLSITMDFIVFLKGINFVKFIMFYYQIIFIIGYLINLITTNKLPFIDFLYKS
jgi:hypothetical protein